MHYFIIYYFALTILIGGKGCPNSICFSQVYEVSIEWHTRKQVSKAGQDGSELCGMKFVVSSLGPPYSAKVALSNFRSHLFA